MNLFIAARFMQASRVCERTEWGGVLMTIEETLEALAKRDQALAESVELMLHGMNDAVSGIRELRNAQRRTEGIQRKNELIMADTLGSINALARIAASHEKPISNLEGGRV
jgi:translation initiation factor IF-2